MKKRILLIFLVALANSVVFAQSKLFIPDTTFNKKRTIITSSLVGAGWAGSIFALKEIWYKESLTAELQSYNDLNHWMQMDKMGHIYAGNLLNKDIYQLYRWAGVDKKPSLIIGAATGIGYLASFEILDGFSDQWGFSWSDFGANALGVAWFTSQELLWDEQRFKLKFSVHSSPYAQYRPSVLGSTFSERMLKDYNGQTYWLSITPSMFLSSESNFPKWLSFSFGYSVDEKLNGEENTYFYTNDMNDHLTVFQARRQYLFSLDIDFQRIPTKKTWLKTLFQVVNHIKIPFPAVEFSKTGFGFHPFYF